MVKDRLRSNWNFWFFQYCNVKTRSLTICNEFCCTAHSKPRAKCAKMVTNFSWRAKNTRDFTLFSRNRRFGRYLIIFWNDCVIGWWWWSDARCIRKMESSLAVQFRQAECKLIYVWKIILLWDVHIWLVPDCESWNDAFYNKSWQGQCCVISELFSGDDNKKDDFLIILAEWRQVGLILDISCYLLVLMPINYFRVITSATEPSGPNTVMMVLPFGTMPSLTFQSVCSATFGICWFSIPSWGMRLVAGS